MSRLVSPKRTFPLLALWLALALAGCGKAPPPAQPAPGPATISVTRWSHKTEMFMEHPPLVKGARHRFAIHFTNLSDFKPLSSGTVTVSLKRGDGPAETFGSDVPSRPGIFGVDVTPGREGKYAMSVSLTAPALEDFHDIGSVEVYASDKQVPALSEETGKERISFLKEQQWTLEFATALADQRSLRESLTVPGDVRPRTGGEAEVIAPISGRIGNSPSPPPIGEDVSAGRLLVSLVPHAPDPSERPVLELAIAESKTGLQLAERDRGRAERLLAAGAAPAKRLEEALSSEASARARVKAAEERLQQFELSRRSEGPSVRASAFAVRSPISGAVAAVTAVPGANVNQGDALFRIVTTDRVLVAARVPEADLPRLRSLAGAEIEVPGGRQVLPAGRFVSRANLIDPQSRTLAVLYEAPNPGQLLAVGQAVTVRLFLSHQVHAVAVPESAIVDDGGRPVVFVQTAGESFDRRPVKLGIRQSGVVQITEGVQAGERIVTKGAYLIRLAAMSTQIPAHGHVH